MIPLGNYLPDQPATGQHATIAHNCIPEVGYYGPIYSPVRYGDALGETCLGAFASRNISGTPYNFAGTDSYLKKITTAAWEDVSQVGGYNTGTGRWDFTVFGDRVIATNGVEKPQSYVMGTSTDFADLTSDAVIAKYCATVRGFVFLGYTIESGTTYRNRVRWSALEDPTVFTASVTTQSDYQDLFGDIDIGNVMRIAGGETATIFCERAIFRGTYIGGDLIMQFDQIASGNGTRAPFSVASFGDMIFFLGLDGFYMLNAEGFVAIGEGAVNRTFFDELYVTDIDSITATIDPWRSLYIVAYPTTAGGLDKFLIYNWASQKWTTADTGNINALYVFRSESWTVDGSSATIGNIDTGTYADVPVDSPFFIQGEPSLAGIDKDGYSVTYNGDAQTARMETAEFNLNMGGKTLIKNVIPFVEGSGSTITAQIGYRNTPQEAVTYTNESTMNSEGECNLFNTARYQRMRLNIAGGFTKAFGVEIKADKAGKY